MNGFKDRKLRHSKFDFCVIVSSSSRKRPFDRPALMSRSLNMPVEFNYEIFRAIFFRFRGGHDNTFRSLLFHPSSIYLLFERKISFVCDKRKGNNAININFSRVPFQSRSLEIKERNIY